MSNIKISDPVPVISSKWTEFYNEKIPFANNGVTEINVRVKYVSEIKTEVFNTPVTVPDSFVYQAIVKITIKGKEVFHKQSSVSIPDNPEAVKQIPNYIRESIEIIKRSILSDISAIQSFLNSPDFVFKVSNVKDIRR